MAAITPTALARARASRCRRRARRAAASSGTSARIGIAATSWSSSTLSMLWPDGGGQQVALGQRRCRPMAVDDIGQRQRGHQRDAPVDAERQRATAVISAAEPNSCTLPQPKIGRRSAHRRRGSQLEADQEQHQHDAELGEVQDVLRVGDELQAPRPDHDAGGQVADDRAQAERSAPAAPRSPRRPGTPGSTAASSTCGGRSCQPADVFVVWPRSRAPSARGSAAPRGVGASVSSTGSGRSPAGASPWMQGIRSAISGQSGQRRR